MPHPTRTTPEKIILLAPNECFVFGSNLAGRHGKGAALCAATFFGAIRGVGVGPTGRCYAIPTKNQKLNTLPLSEIQHRVMWFKAFAYDKPERIFLVTPIGCGLAGLQPEDIAPFFADAPDNVVLPQSFLDVIEKL